MHRRPLVLAALVLVALFAVARATPAAVAPCSTHRHSSRGGPRRHPRRRVRRDSGACGLCPPRRLDLHPADRPTAWHRPRPQTRLAAHHPGRPRPGIKDMLLVNGPDEELRQYYDVVTFDPRGIGEQQSPPLRAGCYSRLSSRRSTARPRARSSRRSPGPTRRSIQSCLGLTGDLWTTSRPGHGRRHRAHPPALGQNERPGRLWRVVGSPYGTAYLERYGDRVKTLVLDGVVDHSIDLATFLSRNSCRCRTSFDRFARWCARGPACALHGGIVGAAFDAAVAAVPASARWSPSSWPRGTPGVRLVADRPPARRGDRRRHLHPGCADAASAPSPALPTTRGPGRQGRARSAACTAPITARRTTTRPCWTRAPRSRA